MATPAEVLQQFKRLFTDLTIRQKVVAAAVALAVMVSFISIFFFANQTSYGTLYTDLSSESAAEITAWLGNEGIPCRTVKGGTVQVPDDKVYSVRLALASAGLPKGGGVGFEIFDKTNLGATDFAQQINYQRALQGELERTIGRFPQVESARVHLAQPKESLFVSERREPTASVVLRLKKGEHLGQSQVNGIAHLVSSAVPRLKEENVSVVDTSGRVLNERDEPGNDFESLTSAQLVYQRRLEDYYKQKIQSMLEDALGPDKAVARVSAEIDFDQVQINEDRFDPDLVAVRSEQKVEETATDQKTGGIPGVKGGLADKLQGNARQEETGLLTQKKQDITNYEISRTQRQVNGAIGKLQRLSVGVLVDGTYRQDGKDTVYAPRTEEEIASLEQIVKAAIGFSVERGDDVSVVNVPFSVERAEPHTMSRMVDIGSRFMRPIVNLVLALVFIFLVLRPLLNRYVLRPQTMRPSGSALTTRGGAALTGGELEQEPPIALAPLSDPQKQLKAMATEYPERAAALVKIWLREGTDADKTSGRQPARG
jgi:flagellar M-ring protein FliF